jgi:hypothetical protein
MRLALWSFVPAAAASVLFASPAQAQTSRFDGIWSVEVVTEEGSCDRAYRYRVIIENGRARYGGPERFDVDGRVRRDGRVSASIARGQDRAVVTGRLAGDFGRGTWVTRGSRRCAGNWNAERGAETSGRTPKPP